MNRVAHFRAIELFAGAGGMAVGLARSGFETVFANDVDPDMCATFEKNHPGSVVRCGNVAELSAMSIESVTGVLSREVDLIAGGPPCQGFSTVGKKDEFDTRNSLPFHFLRLVEEVRPRAVLFENVSGFRRLYEGRIFDLVVSEFDRLGYRPHYKLLNAVDFGVPQHRIRTIIVGFRDGRAFDWPQPTHGDPGSLFGGSVHLTLQDALSDLPLVRSGEWRYEYASPPDNGYQASRRIHSGQPLYQDGPMHGDGLLEVMSHVPPGGAVGDIPVELRPKKAFGNTYARLWWDRPSTTITRNLGTPSSSRCIHPLVDRGLTSTEGARLQSFDDDYEFVGGRSSRNLQIGNAVPPLLAAAVGRAIADHLR
jgi:DNA (cytosine-5)-methyltransferase 1